MCVFEIEGTTSARNEVIILPVSKLDKLDGVGLDIDGEVGQMAAGVQQGLEEDEEPNHLVEIDVVVEGEDGGQPEPAEDGDGIPEHEGEH